jgi:hypothetical protein
MKYSVRKHTKSLKNKRRNTKKQNRKTRLNKKSMLGGADDCRLADAATRNERGYYALPGFWEKMQVYTPNEYNNAKNNCNIRRQKEMAEKNRKEREMQQKAQSKLNTFQLEAVPNT